MTENLFLAFYNGKSKRHAVISDDGITAWLYLHQPSDDSQSTADVDAKAFVYNRGEWIEVREVGSYRPGPPPIAKGYGHEIAVCSDPSEHEWSIHWSADGESVVLLRDTEPWCLIATGDQDGYSKSIRVDGPWGHPWDDAMLEVIS